MHRAAVAAVVAAEPSPAGGAKLEDVARGERRKPRAPRAPRSPRRPGSAAWLRACAAFAAAIGEALEAAASVDRDPVESVHAFRRATRRARAIVATVAQKLPAAVQREIVAALRSAIRDTGALRDRDVLPQALAALPLRPGTEEARATLEASLLTRRASERRPLSRARRLAVAAARLGLLPDRFAAALPADLEEEALGEGIARLARRARKAASGAAERPDELALAHLARKRIRMLAAAHGALLAKDSPTCRRADRLARLSTELGQTLDLDLLARHARRTRHGGGGDAGARRRLLDQLEQRPRRRRRDLLERASRHLRRRHWKPARLIPA